MTEPVVIAHRTGVMDITLNTPDNGNLISNAMGATIIAALSQVPADTKLVRLLAVGSDFCRGRVSPMPPKGTRATAFQLRGLVAEPALDLYNAFRATPVPVLAVVSGRAFGVGTALAVACDLAIAADDAVFQVPEMNHDIPPLLVMTAMMAKLPLNAIAHLALSAETIPAMQAREWGIVTQVVAPASLNTAVEDMTKRFEGYSTVSVRALKEFLRSGKEMTYQGAKLFAGNLSATSHSARYAD